MVWRREIQARKVLEVDRVLRDTWEEERRGLLAVWGRLQGRQVREAAEEGEKLGKTTEGEQ